MKGSPDHGTSYQHRISLPGRYLAGHPLWNAIAPPLVSLDRSSRPQQSDPEPKLLEQGVAMWITLLLIGYGLLALGAYYVLFKFG